MKEDGVLNIVICYNNYQEVIDYHKKILELEYGENVSYIVVINSCNREGINILYDYLKRNENVFVFNPNKNLGYMNGLIYGYNEYKKQTEHVPQYVIMSNTDIAFSQKDFLTRLLNKKYHEDVWCIGPTVLVNEYHSYDNPVADKRYSKKEINTLIRKFSIPLFRELYVTMAFIKPHFYKRKKDEVSRNVYEVHGCFFIITGTYAEYIKNMEYGVLLYSEEIFIAENVYLKNKKTFYDADLEVVHLEHATTSKIKPTQRAKLFEKSMKWIRDNYYANER